MLRWHIDNDTTGEPMRHSDGVAAE